MAHRPWTADEEARLRSLYPDTPNRVIADRLGRTEPAILNRAIKLGLRKAADYCNPSQLQAGNTPWNKGLKGWQAGGRSAETRFRQGNKPHTWHPIGHERITRDGYLERKTADSGITRHDYRPVHHLLWIEAHGPIPAGHAVGFRDGDKTNIKIDNLELIHRAELMQRNSVHRLPKPVAKAVQLMGALRRQINQRTQNEKTS